MNDLAREQLIHLYSVHPVLRRLLERARKVEDYTAKASAVAMSSIGANNLASGEDLPDVPLSERGFGV